MAKGAIKTVGQAWSPGFSRRDVGNFDDCEMFKLAENVTRAPAKAGTPYLDAAGHGHWRCGQYSTYWHFFDFGLPVSAFSCPRAYYAPLPPNLGAHPDVQLR